jgi:hypothetical protein
MNYDVFISFKNSGKDGKPTPDNHEARRVYEALKSIGLKVFFSEESLAEIGKGHFSRSIEAALDDARILVLVASCREHIESRWVEAEWDSFLQDVRSGKKQGEMFIVNCGCLRATDLPLFLRRQQMFQATDLDRLVRFIASALPAKTTVEDVVKLSLHCFRPEQKEDKVYLLAVHPGTAQDRYHVTAYWGARSARRLSSQMKAINATSEEAAAELEKARQEKLRGGYRPKSMAKIITPEARAQLLASLGIADAAPLSQKAASVHDDRLARKKSVGKTRKLDPLKPVSSAKSTEAKKPRTGKAIAEKVVPKKVPSKKVAARKATPKNGAKKKAFVKAPRKPSK